MQTTMQVTGSCHCGAIAYRATVDPAQVVICHCTDCQQLTGTAYRVSVPTSASSFQLLKGTPKVYVKVGDNGARRGQGFCGDCGSPIYTYAADEPEIRSYGLRVGCIQERRDLAPMKRIWCRSELPWSLDVGQVPGRAQE